MAVTGVSYPSHGFAAMNHAWATCSPSASSSIVQHRPLRFSPPRNAAYPSGRTISARAMPSLSPAPDHRTVTGLPTRSDSLASADVSPSRRHHIFGPPIRERLGRRSIIELWVHPHEPSSGNFGRLNRHEQFQHLERISQHVLTRIRRPNHPACPTGDRAGTLANNHPQKHLAKNSFRSVKATARIPGYVPQFE